MRKSRILSNIRKLESRLASLEKALEEASIGVKSYRFDSAEASQQATRNTPEEILKQIRLIESRIETYYKKLDGTGLVTFTLRR